MKTAYFGMGLTVDLPDECVRDCSGPGRKDEVVAYWAGQLTETFTEVKDEDMIRELREYGAWDTEELNDREANIRRIVWLGACMIREEEYEKQKEFIQKCYDMGGRG